METTKQCNKCSETKPTTSFSKHSGTKDKLDNRCKECVKLAKQKSKDDGVVKEYQIYPIDMNNLEWQLGKPTGTVLDRTDTTTGAKRYEVRIPLGDGKMKSKSFAHNNYRSPEDAKVDATKWMHKFSRENNLTKNMIKIIDDSTIDVQLTKNMIMKTDIQFLDLVQKYTILSTKSGNEGSNYYASLIIGNTLYYFHKHITGNDMTDHINRNPMDNRLVNLRKTTSKLNNNNRGPPVKKKEEVNHLTGIRFIHKDEAWQARIKQDNKEHTKTFSIKKNGYEDAKQRALDARKELCKKFNCENN